MVDSSVTAMIISLSKELKKEFIETDVLGRATRYFQAPLHTENGEPCLVTEVEYLNPTSTFIVKSKESVGTWDAAYDI